MAQTDLSGFNGAVTLPSGHGGQAKGFTVKTDMNTKDTSRYGGNRFSKARGGMLTVSGDINIFFRMAAANTSPGWVTPAVDGSALTLTLETGCTLSGTALFKSISGTHAMGDPAIEGTYSFQFNGDVTEAWAVT